MARPNNYKIELLNQLINLFWTIISFTSVLWFWVTTGIDLYFYLILGAAIATGMLPMSIFNLFTLSSNKKTYERLGVRHIRKFVQNGDAVKTYTTRKNLQISSPLHAQRYLETIAMYERYHWACFVFFILTAILCFCKTQWKIGLAIVIANTFYNLGSICLQQYNKIRIRKMMERI